MKISLGYELGTGQEVELKPSHLIVCGVTQLSGKTTTLEALINRSGMKAIAFKTKPGEAGFTNGSIIRPYFSERSDWQYVQSLLEATMKERMKFERAMIIRMTKGTVSLKQVKVNVDKMLNEGKIRSFDRDILTNLQAYFEIIIPRLERIEFAKDLKLSEGVNIMDLEKMPEEVQSLVIRSTIEKVLNSETNTIVIIPEAWKFLPQGRGNPVKQIAESFIRQGAAKGNYLWIDSQDMSGVDKGPLKQISAWILGLQTERNEVQHTLDQISLPTATKPKAEEIMTLKLGHFICVTPEFVKRVYVRPSWLGVEEAKAISMDQLPVEATSAKKKISIKDLSDVDVLAMDNLRKKLEVLAKANKQLEFDNETLKRKLIDIEKKIDPKLLNLMSRFKGLIDEIENTNLPMPPEERTVLMNPIMNAPMPAPVAPISQSPAVGLDINNYPAILSLGGGNRKVAETLLKFGGRMPRAQLPLASGCSISNINQNILPDLRRFRIIDYDREKLWLVGM